MGILQRFGLGQRKAETAPVIQEKRAEKTPSQIISEYLPAVEPGKEKNENVARKAAQRARELLDGLFLDQKSQDRISDAIDLWEDKDIVIPPDSLPLPADWLKVDQGSLFALFGDQQDLGYKSFYWTLPKKNALEDKDARSTEGRLHAGAQAAIQADTIPVQTMIYDSPSAGGEKIEVLENYYSASTEAVRDGITNSSQVKYAGSRQRSTGDAIGYIGFDLQKQR